MMIRLFTVVFFALFPILFVFFRNEAFIREGGVLTAGLIVAGVALLLYGVLNRLKSNASNNVLIVILISCWFSLYGHVYYFLLETFDIHYSMLRHRYYFPIYSLLFLLPVVQLWKQEKSLSHQLIQVLFAIGLSLHLQFVLPAYRLIKAETVQASNHEAKVHFDSTGLPDVYYFISDSYPNATNLKRYYNFDNRAFLDSLKSLGFQVQEAAQSNYPYTYFSLASSLNMEYINYFEDSVSLAKGNEEYPFTRIYTNAAADYFRSKGYEYVVFQSAYEQLNNQGSADLFVRSHSSLNQFYQALLELNVLTCLNIPFYNKKVYAICREAFENLPGVTKRKGAKFVFFHCLPPHPPFVFDAAGNFVEKAEKIENSFKRKDAYVAEIRYVNGMLLKSIRTILKNATVPPVIIIQGDHGSSTAEMYEDEMKWQMNPSRELLKERYGILQAIYIPRKYDVVLPKDHTPVNTFPLVFNAVFKDSLRTLPNKSYFARYRKPYDFREINWSAVDDPSLNHFFY